MTFPEIEQRLRRLEIHLYGIWTTAVSHLVLFLQ